VSSPWRRGGGGRRRLGVVVARAREATREDELNWGRKRATRGSDPSRRWHCGGGEAAARGAVLPASGKQSRGPRARGGRRGERGPGDLFVISKEFRDLSVN
jgi:hypothetical protein